MKWVDLIIIPVIIGVIFVTGFLIWCFVYIFLGGLM